MIDFFASDGPASRSVAILLEEAALDYVVRGLTRDGPPRVRIQGGAGEIAEVVGRDAILGHLATLSGRFLPPAEAALADIGGEAADALARMEQRLVLRPALARGLAALRGLPTA